MIKGHDSIWPRVSKLSQVLVRYARHLLSPLRSFIGYGGWVGQPGRMLDGPVMDQGEGEGGGRSHTSSPFMLGYVPVTWES